MRRSRITSAPAIEDQGRDQQRQPQKTRGEDRGPRRAGPARARHARRLAAWLAQHEVPGLGRRALGQASRSQIFLCANRISLPA